MNFADDDGKHFVENPLNKLLYVSDCGMNLQDPAYQLICGTKRKTNIQDPIYGLIAVSDLCVAFMNTPEFQRLRRIKQLGMTSEVFPSGTHTRAEHCLGVMSISGVFFEYLVKNSGDEWGEFKDYKGLIELAGLLHDLGHGPKSHLFEEAMKIRNIKFCHEQHSIELIHQINGRLGILNAAHLMILESMILGTKIDDMPDFLFEIVANKDSGLDTDKMDYLKRDAYHIGKPVINTDYILKHSRVDRYGHVSYSEKTYSDITALFAMRKSMYEQVYFHKTVVKIDRMMICALCQIPIDENDAQRFFKLDDCVLENLIRNELKHDVVRCLDNRKFDHKCEKCPGIKLRRVAKLSGDTDDNPLNYVRFYYE